MGFAQIRLRFVENMMRFAQIWQNSDDICSNPMTIWCIFAQILWFLQKSCDDLMFFCLNLVIFAQIQWRSSEKYRSPSKCNLRQHHRRLRPIRPLIKQLRSDLTRWFLRLVAGLLTGNPMWSGRFWVGHKPNPDRSVDTPNNSND